MPASVDGELNTYLAGYGSVATAAPGGIYTDVAEQGKEDYLVIHRTAGAGEHHQGAATGLRRSSFQVDGVATTGVKRAAMRTALIDALDGFRGVWGGVTVRRCIVVDDANETERAPDGSEAPDYGVRMDLQVWYEHAVPAL